MTCVKISGQRTWRSQSPVCSDWLTTRSLFATRQGMSGFAMLTDAVALLGVLLAQVLVALLLRSVGLWLAAGAAVWARAAACRTPPA